MRGDEGGVCLLGQGEMGLGGTQGYGSSLVVEIHEDVAPLLWWSYEALARLWQAMVKVTVTLVMATLVMGSLSSSLGTSGQQQG